MRIFSQRMLLLRFSSLCVVLAGGLLATATWAQDPVLKELSGHGDPCYFVTYSPDGKTIATAGFDKTIKLVTEQNSCREGTAVDSS